MRLSAGPSHSQLTHIIDTIATQMEWLLQHQSNQAYPRTKFTKGVQKSTLMAHKMTDVILVLVATLCSTEGRNAILNAKNEDFLDKKCHLSLGYDA
jgi:hypothetical protein